MNGSDRIPAQNQQSLPKFRIVPGRSITEISRPASRTNSWNSTSNSQDGSFLHQSRPSSSSFPSEHTASSSQVPSQNVSFAQIKEESSYYASPSPSQPNEDDLRGAVRYGVPSTSAAAVLAVNVNGNQNHPVGVSAVSSAALNGNVSMVSTMASQVQSPGVPNGVKHVQVQQVHQYAMSQAPGPNENAQQPMMTASGNVMHRVVNQMPAPVQQQGHQQQAHQQQVQQQQSLQQQVHQQQSQQQQVHQQQVQVQQTPNAQNIDQQAVMKCARFFRTLIQLSNQPDHQQSAELVTGLVRDVIKGQLEVEQFTARLQKALGSKAQPHLQPFLQKTLPALRDQMQRQELILEGMNLSQIVGVIPAGDASTFSAPEAPPVSFSNGQQIVMQQRIPPPGMGNVQYVQSGQHLIKTDGPAPMTRMGSMGVNGTPSPASVLSTPPPNSVGAPPSILVKSEPIEPGTPVSISSQHEDQPKSNAPGPSITYAQAAPQMPATTVTAPVAAPAEQIQTKPFTNVQMLNQYRVLSLDVLLSRIRHAMPETSSAPSSANSLPADDQALTLLAQAAEYRLRKVLTHVSTTAEHRSEQLRSNPNYRQLDDHRRQLKFVEEMEKIDYERRENREKEALIRMSKSKGKDKDTLEKAKQIQQADQLAARNRDANAAAMAALSGTKKRRLDDPLGQSVAHGVSMSNTTSRPRTKRVLTKDFLLVLSQDKFMKDSELRLRLLYTSSAKEQSL
uniref:TAFH domain-containing protein n=1 Tax=Steinernema glaseri TaxID=37863 RepID=A0A1I7YYF6_9BILA